MTNEPYKSQKEIFPPLTGENNRTAFYGYTCIGGRPEDQDCLVYDEAKGRQVFSVCDGMGGHAGGCVASRLAAKVLIESFRRQDAVPIADAIVTAVADANYAVYRKAQEEPSLRGMGTTLTILVIDDEAAYVSHIGDSRIYQFRKGQKIYRTSDHSRVFEQVAKGKMTEEEANTDDYIKNPCNNSKGCGGVMRVAPVIDSCFANQYFTWGDAPELRWATNNTKLIRYGRKIGSSGDADVGNYVYGKIEAKSRKTDPFMAVVAAMTIEDKIIERRTKGRRKLDVVTY